MDLICPICGEPWDFESLHDETKERYGVSYYVEPDGEGYVYGNPYLTKTKNPDYNEDEYGKVYKVVSEEFRRKGCKALTTAYGSQENCSKQNVSDERDPNFNLTRTEAASALYDILGDDMDGAAAMLEDMGY